MGHLSLVGLQEGFVSLINQADPEHLGAFCCWLDLKIAHFKISGSFSAGVSSELENLWLHQTAILLHKLQQVSVSPCKTTSETNGHRCYGNTSNNHYQTFELASLLSAGGSVKDEPALDFTNRSTFAFDTNGMCINKRTEEPLHFTANTIAEPDACLTNAVMLKIPSINGQVTSKSLSSELPLEPLDFSRPERLDSSPVRWSGGNEMVRSLLRAALTKPGKMGANAASPERSLVKDENIDVGYPDFSSNGHTTATMAGRVSTTSTPEKMSENGEVAGSKNSCPYCSKTFLYRSSYRRHVKIHQGIFSHVCIVCGRKFTRKEHFVRHKCNRRPNKPFRTGPAGEILADQEAMAAAYQIGADAGSPLSLANHVSRSDMEASPMKKESDANNSFESGSFYDEHLGANDEEGMSDIDDVPHQTCESRRKSSMPRKLVIMSDVDDDDDGCLHIDDADQSSERGCSPNLELASDYPQEFASDDGPVSNGANSFQRISNAGMPVVVNGSDAMCLTNNCIGLDVSSNRMLLLNDTMMGAYNIKLNTGDYAISQEPNTNNAEEGKVLKIKKQGAYLKLRDECRIGADGNVFFACPHCDKTFHRSSNFSRHMRIHRGVYSYVCQTCSRGFFRREHLQKHKCLRNVAAAAAENNSSANVAAVDLAVSESEIDKEAAAGCADQMTESVSIDSDSAGDSGELPLQFVGCTAGVVLDNVLPLPVMCDTGIVS